MNAFDHFNIRELKLVYRVLHQHLMEHLELMDAAFFDDLQRWLQARAKADGIDVANHGEWDAWLGNSVVSCELRMSQREVLT